MDLIIIIGAGVLGFFAWVLWAIIAAIVLFAAVGIPFFIWEGFMFLTFNNIINLFAKLPSFIGWLFGFILTLPFAIIATTVTLWAYIQACLMGLLTFRGFYGGFAEHFIQDYVTPWESGWPKSFVIARYYYEHCQWLWGGAGFQYSFFPWQNNCGGGWMNGDFWWPVCEIPVPFMIIKLILLAIPYMALFVLPLLPLLWSIVRPFVGAAAALPAVSGNCGKD